MSARAESWLKFRCKANGKSKASVPYLREMLVRLRHGENVSDVMFSRMVRAFSLARRMQDRMELGFSPSNVMNSITVSLEYSPYLSSNNVLSPVVVTIGPHWFALSGESSES